MPSFPATLDFFALSGLYVLLHETLCGLHALLREDFMFFFSRIYIAALVASSASCRAGAAAPLD